VEVARGAGGEAGVAAGAWVAAGVGLEGGGAPCGEGAGERGAICCCVPVWFIRPSPIRNSMFRSYNLI
jgi:hypothetical protein